MSSLPCNIFHSFEESLSMDVLRQCLIVFIIAMCVQLLYLVLNPILYRRFPMERRVVMQYATICNNAGFMGLPVIESVFGATGVLYGSIVLIPIRLFMWTMGLSLFTKSDKKQAFKRLATHPCIWAVILGFAYMFLPWKLPMFLSNAINILGQCTMPLAMLIVGSILSEVNFKTVLKRLPFIIQAFGSLRFPRHIHRFDAIGHGSCRAGAYLFCRRRCRRRSLRPCWRKNTGRTRRLPRRLSSCQRSFRS